MGIIIKVLLYYKLLCADYIYQGVVTFIMPVEPYAFATGIKIFDSCLIDHLIAHKMEMMSLIA